MAHDPLHPELLRRFPELAGALPWHPIGRYPTPIRRLDALSRRQGAELWLKADDRAGPVYGGNKVRKLEPLLAEAKARGARGILTTGGIGSHHTVATAVHAGALSLSCEAVVMPQPVTPAVRRNLQLCLALGVTLHPCPSRLQVPLHLAARAARHPELYAVGPGGSSPLGTLGFVAGALELARQVESGALPPPRRLVVALGSGGTAAGLALGCALAGLTTEVVAVAVVERPLANAPLVQLLAARTAALLRRLGAPLPRRPPGLRLEVIHGQAGRTYGAPTAEGKRAVRLLRDLEGVALETTYTGKAMAALLQRSRRWRGPTLFWNTYNSHDLNNLLKEDHGRELPQEIQRWLDRPET